MCRINSKECWRRAGRTFLQTACGVLSAGLVAAVTDTINHAPGWKLGLITLFASAVSAGLAAVMNRFENQPDPDVTPDEKPDNPDA